MHCASLTRTAMSDVSAILSKLSQVLPASARSLGNTHDAIAALLHSILSTSGFTFIAVDDVAPASDYPGNDLPEGWNAQGPSSYTLRYRHQESKAEVLIKLSGLGNHFIVNATAVEASTDCLCAYILSLICTFRQTELHIWIFH